MTANDIPSHKYCDKYINKLAPNIKKKKKAAFYDDSIWLSHLCYMCWRKTITAARVEGNKLLEKPLPAVKQIFDLQVVC